MEAVSKDFRASWLRFVEGPFRSGGGDNCEPGTNVQLQQGAQTERHMENRDV